MSPNKALRTSKKSLADEGILESSVSDIFELALPRSRISKILEK